MALTTTDPNQLAKLAACFDCVPKDLQQAEQTYLLAVLAGVDTSQAGVTALANNAKTFLGIPKGDQIAVQNYLLTQLLS